MQLPDLLRTVAFTHMLTKRFATPPRVGLYFSALALIFILGSMMRWGQIQVPYQAAESAHVDRQAAIILVLHSDLQRSIDQLYQLVSSKDPAAFIWAAENLNRTVHSNLDQARDAFSLTENSSSSIFTTLEVIRTQLDLETEQMVALAQEGDWNRLQVLLVSENLALERTVDELVIQMAGETRQEQARINNNSEQPNQKFFGAFLIVAFLSGAVPALLAALLFGGLQIPGLARLNPLKKFLPQQKTQNPLNAHEEAYRLLAEQSNQVIFHFRLRPQPEFEYLSPTISAITGYVPEKFYEKASLVLERVHSDDRPLLDEIFQGKFTLGETLQVRWLHLDGQIVWTELQILPVYSTEGELTAFEGIVRDISEQHRTQEQVERQFRRLSAQRTIEMAINSRLDLRVKLRIFIEQVALQLQVDAVAIMLYDPDTESLIYGAGRGFLTSAPQFTRLKLGQGFAGQAAFDLQPIHIPDLGQEEDTLSKFMFKNMEGFAAYFATPLISKGRLLGVLEIFHRKPIHPDPDWLDFLDSLTDQAAIAIDGHWLLEQLERSNHELALSYEATLEGWVKALDLRDKETEGHTQRVTEIALRLAKVMGMCDEELIHLRRGALLHDIGKMAISDRILLKPGPLSPEERAEMCKHTLYAYELLSSIPFLGPALDIPYCHHEKWDGSGYPRGLKGEEIPLSARIFSVVDVWDALCSDRPYRKGLPKKAAEEYIRRQSGIHFDPSVVEIFLPMISK